MPGCGIGRLKLTRDGYRCPGGYDDDEYQFCGFTATSNEIARKPWQFGAIGLV